MWRTAHINTALDPIHVILSPNVDQIIDSEVVLSRRGLTSELAGHAKRMCTPEFDL